MQPDTKFTVKLNTVPSDEELISDVMHCINLVAPNYLSARKYNEIGKYHSDTIARRFGNRKWIEALKVMKIKNIPVIKHSDKELLENIANVWIAKGFQPSRRDMDNHPISQVSSGAYLRRYKKWNVALMAFMEYINSNEEISVGNTSSVNQITHRTRREPSNRLKVQVLIRDGNKCRICGTICDEGIHKLHFDHIKPWSCGGETTLDNLRVLCKACNEALGNANRSKDISQH